LEVEWDEICQEPKVERINPLYHKRGILGLQDFLRDKFNLWAGNGSSLEEIWKHFKDVILESIERYITQTIRRKYPDRECYNKEVNG
jgi:hypothetical protein